MTLQDISALAAAYSEDEQALREFVTSLDHDLQEVKKEYTKPMAAALRKARRSLAKLVAAVEEAPELFDKPKTRVFEGVKVGLRKLPDSIELTAEANSIALIRKNLPPDLADALVVVEESIVKGALKNLSKEQLALIDAKLVTGEQAIVAEVVDGDVEKLIAKLLKNAKTLDLVETEADAA